MKSVLFILAVLLVFNAAVLADLPQISKWATASNGRKEPVNIVIIDLLSSTGKEAKQKILKACNGAGYRSQLEQLKAGNNRGRILGPYYFQGYYYFIGAFCGTRARDDFAKKLEKKTNYKVAGFLPMDNIIVDDPSLATGDHDGVAVLLTLR